MSVRLDGLLCAEFLAIANLEIVMDNKELILKLRTAANRCTRVNAEVALLCEAALSVANKLERIPAGGLEFSDAVRIARGCTDYGGGHRSNAEHYEIYQHGIQTVINSLECAEKRGLNDTQVLALHALGHNCGITGANGS